MNAAEIAELLPYIDEPDQRVLDALLSDAGVWAPLDGPQRMAYESQADITGYGGAAGGGKTDLAVGLALTRHRRCLIVRREKAQTEGALQRMVEILGTTDGLNSQKGIWRAPVATDPLIEFAGLDNDGDERRWQGRPHDLKVFDEVTEMREAQVRFIMGWMRTNDASLRSRVLMTFNPPTTTEGRWIIDFFAPWLDRKHPCPADPGELRWFTTIGDRDVEVPDSRPFVLAPDGSYVYDFDPKAYKPEQIITPKSRTFIPARVTDNPYYVNSGYVSTLQALPEPLRSQMLYGDFDAGVQDDPWQVIPTAWVEAAMARWKPRDRSTPLMDSLGVDVARGGRDKTVLARRHANWYDELLSYPGEQTPDGPKVAGLAVAAARNHAVIHLDVIGVGSSPYDFLRSTHQTIGVNVAESSNATDKSGRLGFFNLRSELWWRFREALDPANDQHIALPPDKELLADLCAPKWELSGASIRVESREAIVKRIGRSPDRASAVLLASIDTPKRQAVIDAGMVRAAESDTYDPFANLFGR